eukprot:3787521-Rhodomonas_salina.2
MLSSLASSGLPLASAFSSWRGVRCSFFRGKRRSFGSSATCSSCCAYWTGTAAASAASRSSEAAVRTNAMFNVESADGSDAPTPSCAILLGQAVADFVPRKIVVHLGYASKFHDNFCVRLHQGKKLCTTNSTRERATSSA